MDQENEKAMYDMADKFIDLANEIPKSESYGTIGVAIRYAAARYSAFGASMRTNNLAEDKENIYSFLQKLYRNAAKKL